MDSKERRDEAFRQWWDLEVSGGQWTILERMAAHDAWFAALSTIDPEAIRREAGQAAYDHAAVFQRRLASAQEALIKYPAIVTRLVRGYGIDVNEKQIGAYLDDQLSAILGAEPAQDDEKPEDER